MTAVRLAVAAAVLAACAARSSPPAHLGTVHIDTSAGQRRTVTVELARTPEQRERGLMYRTKLDQDAGMLFLFEQTEPHAFWMKNTLIPLDLVYISEDGRIAAILEKAAPQTLTARDGGVASRYVLEVNGGWTRANGVGVGDRVKFEGVLF